MPDDRPRYPIGALRRYIERTEEWLCVTLGPKTRRRWDRRRRRWVYPDLERARPEPAAPPPAEDWIMQRPARARRPWPRGLPDPPGDVLVRVDVGPPGCLVHEVWGAYGHAHAIHWPDGRVERLEGLKEHRDYVAARGGLVWPTFRAAIAAVPLDVGRKLAWDWDLMP